MQVKEQSASEGKGFRGHVGLRGKSLAEIRAEGGREL